MSQVENRVVRMQFDNSNFEQNVRTSMATMDSLEKSLDNLDQKSYFKNLNKDIKNVDVTHLNDSLTTTSNKFSMLEEIATGALRRIGEALTNTTVGIAKSLSIDNLAAGMSKYEDEMVAVRTIMNATGADIDTVTGVMEKLMQYSDDTSYNYGTMVTALSKFVSYGIPLEKSAEYIFGVGNMAGFAGATIGQATHAYEGFAKALGRSSMSLQLWRTWMSTSSLNSVALKKVYMEQAAEAGTLIKVTDDLYKTVAKGTEVTVGTFDETLREGWLDTEKVMKPVLQMWGSYTTLIQDMANVWGEVNEEEMSSYELMDLMMNGWEGNEDVLRAYAKTVQNATGEELSLEEASKRLNEAIKEMSKTGYESGTVYKTFTDAIEATKDSVSSAWKAIFKNVMGDAETSVTLWTAVGETLLEVFRTPLDAVVDVSAVMNATGSIQSLIDIVESLYTAVSSYVTPIKEAFLDVFGVIEGQNITNLLNQMARFNKVMTLSDEAMQGLYKIVKLVLAPFKAIWNIVRTLAAGFVALTIVVKEIIEKFLELIASGTLVRDTLTKIFGEERYLRLAAAWEKITTSLSNLFSKLGDKIKEAYSKIAGSEKAQAAFKKIADTAAAAGNYILDKIVEGVEKLADLDWNAIFEELAGWIDTLVSAASSLWDALEPVVQDIKNFFASLSGQPVEEAKEGIEAVKTTSEVVKDIADQKGVFDTVGSLLQKAGEKIRDFFANVTFGKIVALTFAAALASLVVSVASAINAFGKMFKGVTTIIDNVGVAIKQIGKSITGFFNSLSLIASGAFVTEIAISIGILTAALIALSFVPAERLKTAGIVLGSFAGGLLALGLAISVLSKAGKMTNFKEFAADFIGLAAGLALMAAAIALIPIDDKLGARIAVLGGFIAVFTLLGVLFSKVKVIGKGLNEFSNMMIKFGVAVNLLVMPITILSLLNSTKMAIATAAVAGLIVVMSLMSLVMSKCKSMSTNVNKFATTMILLATAVNLMVIPITILGLLPEDKLKQGGNAVGIIMGIFAVMALLFTSAKKMYKGMLEFGAAMALMGTSINMMVAPILILGLIPIGIIKQGGLVVGAMLTVFTILGALATKTTGISENIAKFGAAVSLIAVAINLLVPAIFLLGTMDDGVLAQGTVVVMGLMTIVILLTHLAKETGKVDLTSILALCAGIAVIVASLTVLTLLDSGELIVSAMALSGSLLAFGQAMNAMKGWDIKSALTAAGLVLVLMGSLITAFKLMETIDWKNLLVEMVALSATVLALSGALILLSKIQNIDTSVLVGLGLMSVAMIAIAGAMKLMESLNWQDVGEGLLAVAGALAIFLGAAFLIGQFAQIAAGIEIIMLSLQNLGLAMGIFGVAAIAFAYAIKIAAEGVNILASAIERIAALGPEGQQALQLLMTAVGQMLAMLAGTAITVISGVIEYLINSFGDILDAIAENAPRMSQAFIAIGEAILHAIVTLGPQMIEAFGVIISSLCSALEAAIPLLLNLVSMLIEGIYTLLVDAVGRLHELIQLLVDDVLQILRDSASGLGETALYLLETLCLTLEGAVARIQQCAMTIITNFIVGALIMIPTITSGGAAIIVAFVAGILNMLYLVADGAAKAVIEFLNSLANSIRENKKGFEQAANNILDALFGDTFFGKVYKLGKSVVTGFFNGISEGQNIIEAAGNAIGNAAIKGIDEAIEDPIRENGPESDVSHVLGNSVGNGMLNGMLEGIPDIFGAGEGMGANAISGIVDGIGNNIPLLSGAMNKVKSILNMNQELPVSQWDMYGGNTAAAPWITDPDTVKKLGETEDGINDVNNALGDTGKAAGGASKETAKYIDTLTQISDYAGEAIKHVAQDIQNYLGPASEGFETVQVGAEAAVRKFAEYLYEESQAAKTAEEIFKQSQDSTYDRLADMKKVFLEYRNTIAESLKGATNSFSEFKRDVEMTSDDIISNLEGRLEGIREWKNNMKAIIQDGASMDVINNLIKMGPESGYEIVAAIAEGGSDAVAEITDLWAQIDSEANLGTDELLGTVISSMALLDSNFTTSLQTAFNAEKVLRQMEGVQTGIRDGIMNATPMAQAAVGLVANSTENAARIDFAPSVWNPIGAFFDEGIAAGINEHTDWIVSAARAAAQAAYDAAMAELEAASPSKKGKRIGRWFDEGIAIGINKSSYLIANESEEATSLAIQNAEALVDAVASIIDTGIEDPVIRPEFDLSAAEQGAAMLSDIISGSDWLTSSTGSGLKNLKSGANRLASDETSDGKGKGSGVTNYNFTQNNNSPKALSRIEIYRQTKNQFNMLKEVTK